VYVEIKSAAGEARIVEVVQRHGVRYALHSFDHQCIARVCRLAPDVARGVLLDRGISAPIDAMRAAVRETRARDVWPHRTLIDAALMGAARELGVRVVAWTVNSPDDARRLVDIGVDGVCTDDVRLLATL
jgi:glycerophosphoryl diester phosphodiesterase